MGIFSLKTVSCNFGFFVIGAKHLKFNNFRFLIAGTPRIEQDVDDWKTVWQNMISAIYG